VTSSSTGGVQIVRNHCNLSKQNPLIGMLLKRSLGLLECPSVERLDFMFINAAADLENEFI
jgi:hypothetical protein